MKTQLQTLVLTAAFSVTAGLGTASAQRLDLDLNDFSVTSDHIDGSQFELSLFDDDDTLLADIDIDFEDAAGFADPFVGMTDADFTGSLSLSGTPSSGTVTGGLFRLEDDADNVFSFDDITGTYTDSGNRIELVMFLNSDTGDFNSNTFAGVDVSAFNTVPPLDVSVITFYFDRQLLVGNHTDIEADLDLAAVVIPEPATTATLGLIGVAGLLRRRRR